jgi:hypothetical protein
MDDLKLLDIVLRRNVSSYSGKNESPDLSQLDSVMSAGIQLSNKPGIGFHKKAIITQDDPSNTYRVSYVNEDKVESFKKQCPTGFYIVKKWLKPDIDILVRKINAPIRAKLYWRIVYTEVVKGQLVKKQLSQSKLICAIGALYYQKACTRVAAKITRLEKKTKKLIRQKAVVSAFEDQLLKDKFRHKQMVEADFERLKSAHLEADRVLNKAAKQQEQARLAQKYVFRFEEVKLLHATLIHDLRKLPEKKDVRSLPNEEKWFGFVKNSHLEFLQKLTGTPDWLIQKDSEDELEPNQHFEALVSLLRICNITNSRQALFMVNKLVGGKKKKGIAEFKRTFNKVLRFTVDSSLKVEAYTLTVSYLTKMLGCKSIFRNIHYITARSYSCDAYHSEDED